jgi:hypothetical protein
MKAFHPIKITAHLLGHAALLVIMTITLFSFDPRSLEALPQNQITVMRMKFKSEGNSEIFFLIPWSLKNLKVIELTEHRKSSRELSTKYFAPSFFIMVVYLVLSLLFVYRILRPSIFNKKPYA